MSKRNKLYLLLIILIILIFLVRLLFNVRQIKYELKIDNNIFKIQAEKLKSQYYVTLKTNKNTYSFYVDKNSYKKINNIYYYSDDNYECVLPLFDGKVIFDMNCNYQNINYDYQSLKGKNIELDQYVSKIKEYNSKNFLSNEVIKNSYGTINYYNDIKRNLVITTYKGLIVNTENINLFKSDVYNNEISAFIDNYYIVADYDNNYEFKYFYIVNLNNNEVSKLKFKYDISLDSYIQGIVDDDIYLYDQDNQNQYKINVKNKQIKLVSSENKIKYYKNNNWTEIGKPNKTLYFDYTSLNNYFTDYDNVYETEEFYYLIKIESDKNKVYRVDKKNLDIIKYLFETDANNMVFKDEYVYFLDEDRLYYFSDTEGLKLLLENSEFEFNDSLKFYIY